MQTNVEVMLLVLSLLLVGTGTLLIVTSRSPNKNALTKVSFRMCTIAPRVGSMRDETWVLINGVGLLATGICLLARSLFALVRSW